LADAAPPGSRPEAFARAPEKQKAPTTPACMKPCHESIDHGLPGALTVRLVGEGEMSSAVLVMSKIDGRVTSVLIACRRVSLSSKAGYVPYHRVTKLSQ
jgi:hypothetical protein